MPRPHIVVMGSSNTDLIVGLERMPRPGETVLGGQLRTSGGGKGANQAIAASRAGGKVTFIARVGKDPYGDQALAALDRDGIDLSQVTRDARTPSGVAVILVDRRGQNSIAVSSGANAQLSIAQVNTARRCIQRADMLLMQLETPLAPIEAAARIAMRSGRMRIILNPAPARPLPDRLLRRISILTPNESETELLTGIEVNSIASAERAAKRLRSRGIEVVVITLGARGALIADEAGIRIAKGFKVKAIDTTAAGDTFNGALAVALSEGCGLDQAVLFANAAAALSVTCFGSQTSAPTRRAIDRFLRSR